jgi:hypothetical protein
LGAQWQAENDTLAMEQSWFTFPHRSLALAAAQSYEAFLASAPQLAPALRSRQSEIRVPWEEQDFLVNYPDHLHWVILLSEEAPETVVVVPILVRLAKVSPRIALRILRDTDDLSGLNALVDDLDLQGALQEVALPLLLVFDDEWQLQAQWGPHPQAIEPQLDAWFERHPEYETLAESPLPTDQARYAGLLAQFTQEMRTWYNSGLNRACCVEVCALLAGLLDEADEEEELAVDRRL